MRRALALGCVVLPWVAGCARTPRLTAPLQYAAAPTVTPRESFRAKAPEVAATEDRPASLAPQITTLPNGLRIAVVERAGHASVSARLVFWRDAADANDPCGEHLAMMGAVFLPRSDDDASVGTHCADIGCSLSTSSGEGSLDVVLDRLATAIREPAAPRQLYERRLLLAAVQRVHVGDSPVLLDRNAKMILFRDPPYACTPAAGPPTLGALLELRHQVVAPAQATLVVVSDAPSAAVIAGVEKRFGDWKAASSTPVHAHALPAAPADDPRLVLVENSRADQISARLYARGPVGTSGDMWTLRVIAAAIGAAFDSTAWNRVREGDQAAYFVSAGLDATRETSFLWAGGSFDADKVGDGLATLQRAIKELRDQGITAAALARAKTGLLAEHRARLATNAGIAGVVARNASFGGSLDARDLSERIEAVTAADVQRVARAWLTEGAIRAVLTGEVRWVAGDLRQLDLGEPAWRDAFGR